MTLRKYLTLGLALLTLGCTSAKMHEFNEKSRKRINVKAEPVYYLGYPRYPSFLEQEWGEFKTYK